MPSIREEVEARMQGYEERRAQLVVQRDEIQRDITYLDNVLGAVRREGRVKKRGSQGVNPENLDRVRDFANRGGEWDQGTAIDSLPRMSKSTLTRAMKVLVDMGELEVRQEGNKKYYRKVEAPH